MNNGHGLEAASSAISQYGGDPFEGYEAGDDCAQGAVEDAIPLSTELATIAWPSGLGAEEVQDLHLREWVLLARPFGEFLTKWEFRVEC